MARVHQITPFLHVPNLDEAITFLCETLPFVLRLKEGNYAYVDFDGAGLRLLEEPGRSITPDGKPRVSVYVDVDNVDDLYAQLRARLEQLPRERVEPVLVKSWRQKEFQVRLPDGDWLTFGQPAAGIA